MNSSRSEATQVAFGCLFDSAFVTWLAAGLSGRVGSSIPSILTAAARSGCCSGARPCQIRSSSTRSRIGWHWLVIPFTNEVALRMPLGGFQEGLATGGRSLCLNPRIRSPVPHEEYSTVRRFALSTSILLIAGTASRGVDGGDDPTTNVSDRHTANVGLGGDVRTRAPSKAIWNEWGVAYVRTEVAVHACDLPIVLSMFGCGTARPRAK